MAEVSGAEIVNGIIDNHPRPPAQRSIRLGVAATNRLLGTAFRDEQIADSLRRIEFQVTPGDGGELEVVAPSYRVDVSRPEDLMEEVARLAGYNNIPLSYPAVPAEGRPLSKRQGARRRVRGLMEGCGFNEVINYSFIAPDAVDRIELKGESRRRRVVSILNPISEEMAVLRTSLIPGLLETMRRNAALQAKNLRLYEVGRIYLSTGHDALPQEVEMLAALWCGARLESGWYGKESACDFFDLKGIVETLLERLAVRKVRFTALPAKQCEYTRPGFSARIVADAAAVGLIGEIHPRVAEHYELKQTAFIFELDFGRLGPLIPDVINFQPLPRYPAVFRDVTLIVDRSTEAGEILRHIEALKHDLVEALHLFDVFEGAPIPAGRKSISFRITYRSSERTLEDKEINRLHRDITGTLLKEFSASLPA
jgi:phenylalanyl-tRNA synthetase beta chain